MERRYYAKKDTHLHMRFNSKLKKKLMREARRREISVSELVAQEMARVVEQ